MCSVRICFGAQDFQFGRKYVSRAVGNDIREMTARLGWNNEQMVTFKVSVRNYEPTAGDLGTLWAFYLVTDAYPCQETVWGNWSQCDAIPVGIGHKLRSQIQVNGPSGGNRSCNVMEQRERCVVNKGIPCLFCIGRYVVGTARVCRCPLTLFRENSRIFNNRDSGKRRSSRTLVYSPIESRIGNESADIARHCYNDYRGVADPQSF